MDHFQPPQLTSHPARVLTTSHSICKKAGGLVVDWSQSNPAESHCLAIGAGHARAKEGEGEEGGFEKGLGARDGAEQSNDEV